MTRFLINIILLPVLSWCATTALFVFAFGMSFEVVGTSAAVSAAMMAAGYAIARVQEP